MNSDKSAFSKESTLKSHVSTDLLKLKKRLAKQGFADITVMDYEIYLRSTLWKKIRDWVQQRDDFSCVICTRKKTSSRDEFDVHHRNYDLATLEGRDETQLVTLCRLCHTKIEYLNGKKRSSLEEKEMEYQRLMALHSNIVNEGMPLRVQNSTRNGTSVLTVTYIGPKNYTEFYKLHLIIGIST